MYTKKWAIISWVFFAVCIANQIREEDTVDTNDKINEEQVIPNSQDMKKGEVYIDSTQINEIHKNEFGVISLKEVGNSEQMDIDYRQQHKVTCNQDVKIDMNLLGNERDQSLQKVYITIRFINNLAKAYLVPQDFKFQDNYHENNEESQRQEEEAIKEEQIEKKNRGQYLYNYKLAQLKDGVNEIDLVGLKQIYEDRNDIVLYISVQEYSEIIFQVGQPVFEVSVIPFEEEKTFKVEKQDIYGKIYQIQTDQDFKIKFDRSEGYPLIQIYSCYKQNQQCFLNTNKVPQFQNRIEGEDQRDPSLKSLFKIDGMMNKEEEFIGKACLKDHKQEQYCQLYLMLLSRQGLPVHINVEMTQKNKSVQLEQNQPLTQDLNKSSLKKYGFKSMSNEKVSLSINVLEGKVSYKIEEISKNIEEKDKFTIKQNDKQGINQIEISALPDSPLQQRNFKLSIFTNESDSTFTIAYSSGESQILLNDGETFGYQLSTQKSVTLFYKNEQKESRPLFFSVSVIPASAIDSLEITITEIKQTGEKQVIEKHPKDKQQIKPKSKISDIEKQKHPSQLVFEIPGDRHKFSFDISIKASQDTSSQAIATFLISDAQIVSLPLDRPLFLQIDKDAGLNFMVSNNEEGFLELTVKRCDDTDPTIAYSSNSYQFLKKIYEYESPLQGQNQRIIRNSIRVRKGNSLYIHIGGDEISNSFIEITAKYMELSRNKLEKVQRIRVGKHGNLEYQLITNSKVQITFEGLQCGEQCRQQTKYECVWSNCRSQLFRNLYCPNSHIISKYYSKENKNLMSKSYPLVVKPAHADNQISFTHMLDDSIIFMSIRANYKPSNQILYYKDIEIVTISGQLGRMSTNFLIFLGITSVIVIGLCVCVVQRATFRGYKRLRVKA